MKARPLLLAIFLGLPLILLLLEPGPAAAHAELRKATPEPGAVLTRSPAEIRLTFSEPLRAVSTFVVFNRAFEKIPGVEPKVVAGSEEQLTSTVPQLAADIYTVQWNVVGIDGHPSSGSYSFEVSNSTDSAGRQWLLGLFVLATVAVVATLVIIRRRQLLQQR